MFPIPYKNLIPQDKYINSNQNPPTIEIDFFEAQKNIKNINCFSNEGNQWRNPIMEFKKNALEINFREK